VTFLSRIPLTIAHQYDFGDDAGRVGPDLVNPASWDAVRRTAGPFGLPATRAEWERAAARPEYETRAATIARIAKELGARRLCSYGVGAAYVELNLARAYPEGKLICTDFAPQTVERLAVLFPEADVRLSDLRDDSPLPADLHLLHRVDTELPNREWRQVLARFRAPVLLVATELLDWVALSRELRRRLARSDAARAGYIRTEAAMRSLWKRTHVDRTIAVGELHGFLLLPRPANDRATQRSRKRSPSSR
jgi:hypothetical protein